VSGAEFQSIVGKFPVQLQWGDCDPAGIIFYPTYFRWFDAATWNFFAAIGYPASRMKAEHRAMPLVSAECQFLAPMEHQERGEVRSRIARWGGKSFAVTHEAVREDGTLLARGTETRVWGVYAAGPGTPLKGETIGGDLKALFKAR